MTDLRHIDTWVFDMDNTLYYAMPYVFPAMERSMTDYIVKHLGLSHEDASKKRRDFHVRYGTTLRGLMSEHGIDPHHYMHETHKDLDAGKVPQCDVTRAGLPLLPGRRFVFTSAPRAWADAMIGHLGIGDLFDGVFTIEDAGFHPKPHLSTYHIFLEKYGINPKTACMFEDSAKNLEPAHTLGMTTVWIHNGGDGDYPYVHDKAGKLADWLRAYTKETSCPNIPNLKTPSTPSGTRKTP